MATIVLGGTKATASIQIEPTVSLNVLPHQIRKRTDEDTCLWLEKLAGTDLRFEKGKA